MGRKVIPLGVHTGWFSVAAQLLSVLLLVFLVVSSPVSPVCTGAGGVQGDQPGLLQAWNRTFGQPRLLYLWEDVETAGGLVFTASYLLKGDRGQTLIRRLGSDGTAEWEAAFEEIEGNVGLTSDGEQHLYLYGSSGGNITVLCLSLEGERIWCSTMPASNRIYDVKAVFSSGSLLVAGAGYPSTFLCLNCSTGEQAWNATVEARIMDLQAEGDRAYLAGRTDLYQSFTACYGPGGVQLWNRCGEEEGFAANTYLAAGPGRLYVAGYEGLFYVTLYIYCYDQEGKLLWNNTWNARSTYPAGLALEGDKLLLLLRGWDHYVIECFDASLGGLLWSVESQAETSAEGFKVRDGRIYIYGYYSTLPLYPLVACHDLEGNFLWNGSYTGGWGSTTDLEVAWGGSVVAAGFTAHHYLNPKSSFSTLLNLLLMKGIYSDGFTACFTPEGEASWTRTDRGGGVEGFLSLAGGDGFLFPAGFGGGEETGTGTGAGMGMDGLLACYGATGGVKWSRRVDRGGEETIYDVAYSQGRVYTLEVGFGHYLNQQGEAGKRDSLEQGSLTYTLSCFTADGGSLWSRPIKGVNPSSLAAEGGFVYVASHNITGLVMLSCYAGASGELLWNVTHHTSLFIYITHPPMVDAEGGQAALVFVDVDEYLNPIVNTYVYSWNGEFQWASQAETGYLLAMEDIQDPIELKDNHVYLLLYGEHFFNETRILCVGRGGVEWSREWDWWYIQEPVAMDAYASTLYIAGTYYKQDNTRGIFLASIDTNNGSLIHLANWSCSWDVTSVKALPGLCVIAGFTEDMDAALLAAAVQTSLLGPADAALTAALALATALTLAAAAVLPDKIRNKLKKKKQTTPETTRPS